MENPHLNPQCKLAHQEREEQEVTFANAHTILNSNPDATPGSPVLSSFTPSAPVTPLDSVNTPSSPELECGVSDEAESLDSQTGRNVGSVERATPDAQLGGLCQESCPFPAPTASHIEQQVPGGEINETGKDLDVSPAQESTDTVPQMASSELAPSLSSAIKSERRNDSTDIENSLQSTPPISKSGQVASRHIDENEIEVHSLDRHAQGDSQLSEKGHNAEDNEKEDSTSTRDPDELSTKSDDEGEEGEILEEGEIEDEEEENQRDSDTSSIASSTRDIPDISKFHYSALGRPSTIGSRQSRQSKLSENSRNRTDRSSSFKAAKHSRDTDERKRNRGSTDSDTEAANKKPRRENARFQTTRSQPSDQSPDNSDNEISESKVMEEAMELLEKDLRKAGAFGDLLGGLAPDKRRDMLEMMLKSNPTIMDKMKKLLDKVRERTRSKSGRGRKRSRSRSPPSKSFESVTTSAPTTQPNVTPFPHPQAVMSFGPDGRPLYGTYSHNTNVPSPSHPMMPMNHDQPPPPLPPQPHPLANTRLCKYFVDSKCYRGSDCTFSHDVEQHRKRDLCKFYLQGFCGKGDQCLFMHKEFPCKFFHTKVECYSGDKCRFSHSPLNDNTREVLRKYLDSGTLPDDPPELKRQILQTRGIDVNNSPSNDLDTSEKDTHDPSHSSESDEQMKASLSPKQSQDSAVDPSDESRTQTVSPPSNEESSFTSAPTFQSYHPQSQSPFPPQMPLVVKRSGLLGDPTHSVRASRDTWEWQQEMRELEISYTGNKRNLWCIEQEFKITDKPPTPRAEDEEEQEMAQFIAQTEAQRRLMEEEYQASPSFYVDRFGDNVSSSNNTITDNFINESSTHDEDLRLLQASAMDEDLRSSGVNTSAPSSVFGLDPLPPISAPLDTQLSMNQATSSYSVPMDVPQSLPKVAIELFQRLSNSKDTSTMKDEDTNIPSSQSFEIKTEKESIDHNSDDETGDDALLKKLKSIKHPQPSPPQAPSIAPATSSSGMDISKILSMIRSSAPGVDTSSSNTSTVTSPSHAAWSMFSTTATKATPVSDPRLQKSPTKSSRDPRMKRSSAEEGNPDTALSPRQNVPGAKQEDRRIGSSSPTKRRSSSTGPATEILGSGKYKLYPMDLSPVDYTAYVNLYKNDSKMKNDPRLTKFFSKFPSSYLDSLLPKTMLAPINLMN